jgi:hypothetical protein
MGLASLCRWSNRGLDLSGCIGGTLVAEPHAGRSRDNKPFLRVSGGERQPPTQQSRGVKVRWNVWILECQKRARTPWRDENPQPALRKAPLSWEEATLASLTLTQVG